MWRRVNEEVNAAVQHKDDLPYPVLKAVIWKGRRFQILGPGWVETDRNSFYYAARSRSARLAVRFDRESDQWFLEGIDDHARMNN